MSNSADLERLSAQFRALSDLTRLRILALLRGGECCVCELAGTVGAPQPLLSFHLRTLKEAGLVTDRREGRWVHYSVRADALQSAAAHLAKMATPVRAPRCCSRRGRAVELDAANSSATGRRQQ